MNNAALVDNAGTYEIVPLTNAVQGRIVPQLGESSRALPEGYSVQVVPLRYIGADEMSQILEPLAPEGSIVRVDNLRNLIILAGSSPEMSNLLDTIQVFDVDWMAGLSVGFFVLEYAKANDVVTQLETLLADDGGNPSRACSDSSRSKAPTLCWWSRRRRATWRRWRLDRPARPGRGERRFRAAALRLPRAPRRRRRTWPMS
jgi:type II secretory pathway component GspD/PulD (secretin)